MHNVEFETEILIVGAGLAGLMAAQTLTQQGRAVLLVDKGRSVGGRMATRRVGGGRADHGAQFFTARSIQFRDWIKDWQAQDIIYRWSLGWSDGSAMIPGSMGHPRYAIHGGMNALTKHLASDLPVELNVTIRQISRHGAGWEAVAQNGARYTSQAILLTPPVPQSLALLHAGAVLLSPDDAAILEAITYAPCLCGLFWVEGTVNLPTPGAIQRSGEEISWIADNQRKGISPEAKIITVHGAPSFSEAHFDDDEVMVLAQLRAGLERYLGPDAVIKEAQYKRWRYALPTTLHNETHLVATALPSLVFAGDAFGGPRVEGAVLSGLAAGQILTEVFENE